MKVFITGISRGLGAALARELARRGHDVWGVSRSGGDTFHPGAGVRRIQCDIRLEADRKRVLDEMKGVGFTPDAVVLNAMIMDEGGSDAVGMEWVRGTFETGFFGNLGWVPELLPLMKKLSPRGTFVNVSSVSAFRSSATKVSYSAMKAAMDKTFEGLRIRHYGEPIRFVTVHLGPLRDVGGIPMLTLTYERAAAKIASLIEGGAALGSVTYPLLAGIAYRLLRLMPDGLVRRLIA